MDYRLLGKRIRRRRQYIGLTQEQLAEKSRISASFLGHVERGSRMAIIGTLTAIANAMGVSTDSLLIDSLFYTSLYEELRRRRPSSFTS